MCLKCANFAAIKYSIVRINRIALEKFSEVLEEYLTLLQNHYGKLAKQLVVN